MDEEKGSPRRCAGGQESGVRGSGVPRGCFAIREQGVADSSRDGAAGTVAPVAKRRRLVARML